MHALRSIGIVLVTVVVALGTHHEAGAAGVSLGGFVPMVGIGLTDENNENSGTFFIAEPSDAPDGSPLGDDDYDIAILDTGAATHVLTLDAFERFDLAEEGFDGEGSFPIGTAGGIITMQINKPLGVYAAGLGDRNPALTGENLVMQSNAPFRGQTGFATLTAPIEWTLPNIIGLPMAAHHAVAILNSDPQIFPYQDRTLRTPQVELRDIGSGGGDIVRRAELKLRTGENFIVGPLYTFTVDFEVGIIETSPSVLPNSGMFLEIDMANGSKSFADKEFLFDTGADVTVISQATAKKLGFDALLDTPDFFVEVGSPTGVSAGVPGFFVDELNIDTVGGDFTLQNVPVVVLNLPNPNAPGNNLDGLIGMNLFNGRNLVIDAEPSQGQGGPGPSLYISDPVTETHTWASTVPAGEVWSTPGNWSAAGTPSIMWDTLVRNITGSTQAATIIEDTEVFRLTVGGGPNSNAAMNVFIGADETLTTYADVLIEKGGTLLLVSNGVQSARLDAQYVTIEEGTLAGEGDIFVGTGPIHGAVRNISGRIAPSASAPSILPVGRLSIDGDFSNQAAGTLAIDLAPGENDLLDVGRFAFLAGTLEVTLVGGFIPSIGNMFTILTAETVSGEFDSLDLPDGYLWDVTYEDDSVILEVIGLGLAGDYNGDGKVSAADYTVWRDTLGSSTDLRADGNNNTTIDPGDYTIWLDNFGSGFGSGSGSVAFAVPEPSALWLALGSLLFAWRQRATADRFARFGA